MSQESRQIHGDPIAEPVHVKPVGTRWTVLVIMGASMMFSLSGIRHQLRDANELKRDELDIKREQLDLARRQFRLDSIMFEQNQKKR